MKPISTIFLSIASMAFFVSFAFSMSSSNYQINSDVIGVAGGEGSSSDNFKIQDTIGESIATSSTSTSSNFGEKSGFRQQIPDETLTFSVSTTTLAFGNLSSSAPTSATHTMSVVTNAVNGVSITVTGSTLTKGSDTISAIGASETVSSAGSEQFGLNFVDNATPDAGASPSGTSPIASGANHYNVVDNFAFNSGDTVATSTGPINTTTLTATYIANVSAVTETGEYTTTLTYTATGSW